MPRVAFFTFIAGLVLVVVQIVFQGVAQPELLFLGATAMGLTPYIATTPAVCTEPEPVRISLLKQHYVGGIIGLDEFEQEVYTELRQGA